MNLDLVTILTTVGTGAAVVGIIYSFLRNFKTDINSHIDRIENEMKQMHSDFKKETFKMDQRVIETNKRMDGVYNVLLKNK